jgi:23S rRNA pseudouridine2605 synthase
VALERIQKILSAAGVCSRREAEEYIIEGKVKVNGVIVTELGHKADPDRDVIKVGSKVVKADEKKVYLLLNKPRGYVSTLKDPQNRKTVMELLTGLHHRVYPVGRLDYDTEGLLLLTNDGDFSNAMMHPSREVSKTYQVKVSGILSDEDIRLLEDGVRLEDGMTAPAKVKKMKLTDANSWIELTIHEGRNRQVRRMCDAVGHRVMKLKRARVGPLDLKGTPLGTWRELTPAEINAALKAAGKEPKPSSPPTRSIRGKKGGGKAA